MRLFLNAIIRGRRPIMASILIGAALFSFSCGKGKGGAVEKPKKPDVPVTVETVVEKDVPVELKAVGSVEAFSSVAIKSQATGVITKVHFVEGKDVKKGDLLFTIDKRFYAADVAKARANLAKDQANLDNAKKIADRDAELGAKNLASAEEVEQSEAQAKALAATVRADQAALNSASVALSNCTIRSPIDGRAGSLPFKEGNLVGPTVATPLVVINQIKPIYVTFSVPAQYLGELQSRSAAGKLEVRAIQQHGEGAPVKGELTFIDNAVDESTGTIKLKALFDNADLALWPGQFVDVIVTLSIREKAVVAPTEAIMFGQKGSYVFVVKDDMSVEVRDVASGYEIDGDSIVDKGLVVGEKVVIDGQLKLVAGSKVSIKTEPAGK